jgi:hypothetical protein
MRKTLFFALAIIAIFTLIYSALWFALITSISNDINQHYAGRTINTKIMGDNKNYSISFREIKSHGFPFKVAIQIIGWREESKDTLIEFNTPIYLGYDLLKQNLFLSYYGEAIGYYKPISLNFGAIFKNPSTIFTIKLPLSIKLLKVLIQKKDLFQIINFIQNMELKSKGAEILDLYDNKILYKEDFSVITFSFDKKRYYTDIDDFKKNIPQRLDINYTTKILLSNMYDRRVPAGILLYRLAWPTAIEFDTKLLIKTTKSQISEVANDLEIELLPTKCSIDILDSVTSLLYKSTILQDKRNSYIKLSSTINLKSGFSKTILDTIPLALNNPAISVLGLETLATELQHINNNKEMFSLATLENRPYILDLNVNFTNNANKQLAAQINNLSLFSNDTGFRFTSEFSLNNVFKDFDIKGLVVFNNYAKIFNFMTNYIFKFKKFEKFSDDSLDVYKEGTMSFLRTISDHPDANSRDISFEYKLNSSNVKKWRIGTVDFQKVLPLYYLSLYSKAAMKIRAGDDTVTRIKELVPDFNEHQKLLKHLMVQPFQEVNSELWKDIIQ